VSSLVRCEGTSSAIEAGQSAKNYSSQKGTVKKGLGGWGTKKITQSIPREQSKNMAKSERGNNGRKLLQGRIDQKKSRIISKKKGNHGCFKKKLRTLSAKGPMDT